MSHLSMSPSMPQPSPALLQHLPFPPNLGQAQGKRWRTPSVPACGLCLAGGASQRPHIWDKKGVKVDLHTLPLAQQSPYQPMVSSCSHLEGSWAWLSLEVPKPQPENEEQRSLGFLLGKHIPRCPMGTPGPSALPKAIEALCVGGLCQPTSYPAVNKNSLD